MHLRFYLTYCFLGVSVTEEVFKGAVTTLQFPFLQREQLEIKRKHHNSGLVEKEN